jgi:hypothetical protein
MSSVGAINKLISELMEELNTPGVLKSRITEIERELNIHVFKLIDIEEACKRKEKERNPPHGSGLSDKPSL